MSELSIAAIEEVKQAFSGQDLKQKLVLQRVAETIGNHPGLRDASITQSMLLDLEESDYAPKKLKHLKSHINDQKTNTVFSLFYASYFPSLNIDGFRYETLPEPPELAVNMRSPVLAVNWVEATSGFHKRGVVALFPENHIDGVQLVGDKIFYFINRFVERFDRITRKLMPLVDFPGMAELMEMPTIQELAVYWVWLHEHFHRQGPMPIPKYLPYKTLKPLAGLEELRVDMAGMHHCLHSGLIPAAKGRLIATFILTERLLRYAVEGSLKPNYDAIASQILFQYLLKEKAIEIQPDKRLLWRDHIFDAAFKFYQEISAIESLVLEEGPERVQARMLQFACQYNQDKNDFVNFKHFGYFTWLKQEYQV